MSYHTVEHLLWNLNFKPEVTAQFRQSPQAAMAAYPLDDDERRLVEQLDVRALAARGVSQMLLMMVFQTLGGGPRVLPDYLRRMNGREAA